MRRNNKEKLFSYLNKLIQVFRNIRKVWKMPISMRKLEMQSKYIKVDTSPYSKDI